MEMLLSFNYASVLVRIILSVVLGGIIGIERSFHGRAAGMRTHILVCLGSALTVLAGIFAVDVLGYGQTDPMRIAAQVVSGIGFLGAGMIIVKGRFEVVGLTTAAGLWATASIGICVGAGFYIGAIFATVVLLFVSIGLRVYERHVVERRNNMYHMYVEISSVEAVNPVVAEIKDRYDVERVDVTAPRSATGGNVGIELTVHVDSSCIVEEVIDNLMSIQCVVYTIESV